MVDILVVVSAFVVLLPVGAWASEALHMSWVLTLAGVNKKPFTCENQLALGDRYRTLNNAKKRSIQYSIQKN